MRCALRVEVVVVHAAAFATFAVLAAALELPVVIGWSAQAVRGCDQCSSQGSGRCGACCCCAGGALGTDHAGTVCT